ncbi:hypothetical protein [Natrinema longum]|uniref:Uncharacterized protein n=1 Tax=Natrinema longum TaxID=370324 RepID=A0A8A2U7L9_9EURY|nr:hypothetical protein [Natrinema longum]MBZ6493965.1 hypothetical protein [Natrinema longum]QSW84700.1 hypothetical protein J0X27_14785 [Natrinema longum]
MPLIVEAADERTDRNERERSDARSTVEPTATDHGQRRRIDVTDLDAAGLDEFVRTNVETDAVSLEHRGGRTYLLIAD